MHTVRESYTMPQSETTQRLTFDACYVKGKEDLYISGKTLEYTPDREVLVRITRGGICGSDVHYYQHGGIGDIRLQQPMVLGHEVIGTTVTNEPGASVKVAVNPSRPCNACKYCLSGHSNQCMDMLFFGSAMRYPHVDGGFAQYIAVRPD